MFDRAWPCRSMLNAALHGLNWVDGWHAPRYSDGRAAFAKDVTTFGVPKVVPPALEGTCPRHGAGLESNRTNRGKYAEHSGPTDQDLRRRQSTAAVAGGRRGLAGVVTAEV